jgi:hypothetical protein
MTDRCSFPIVGRGERAQARSVAQPRIQGEPWCIGGDCPSSQWAEWPQTMADRPEELADRLAIFADGAPAPLVTSFVASKSFSTSFNVTKAHDMTLVGDASFNGGIFLVATVMDKALKESMVGERMNKSFGGEVREKKMS